MSIDPIAPIAANIGPISGPGEAAATSAIQGDTSFINLLSNAIADLNASISHADQLAIQMAAGREVDLHQVMVALETATIGLQTALQIRNRALEAYREIMSMTI
ncbi:flagellar hook-basal body complex protein FliE [Thermomicrobiaceae bacterium CFH 74404]|uniref:Flagellar hook-basal body complex protein FliE n=1 Tax=Thermalbibacter longus TaxID=2951981 RepID=A0AA41WD03_9BACT|nr:flagellar hook-basal body complex protein FliE [Thermalbibacter longus]MCM8749722.1 flagellar hook-basal body complex protein FliE [Thermalbibacter longus]